jgi:putative transposase
MARFNVTQISSHPFHITGRCTNREIFRMPLPEVWSLMEDYLNLVVIKYGLKIHSFVLMPNHFHLLASCELEIGKVMCDFMTATSKAMNSYTGRINQCWGGRHYKCELKSYIYYINTYKYIYQNPIRCGLVQRVEQWPYSTLGGLCGLRKLHIRMENDLLLFNPTFESSTLKWLNTPISPENLIAIRAALSKREFILPKPAQYLHPLESQRI